MLLQAESIQKFVEPCRHVVIINEDNPDLEFYHKWLDPYYTKHELVLMGRIPYSYPYPIFDKIHNDPSVIGWRIQQLQKLLLAYEFEEDYLIMDTKNFFIKPTSIDIWSNTIGSAKLHAENSVGFFIKSCRAYAKVFGYEMPRYLIPATPFKINSKNITSKCRKSELGYLLFYPEFNSAAASEGVFYSFFVDADELKNAENGDYNNNYTFWTKGQEAFDYVLEKVIPQGQYVMMAIHRERLATMNKQELTYVNNWIDTVLGLETRIIPRPRENFI